MKTYKILFVDDEEVVRRLGRRLLGAPPYELLFADGVGPALEIIASQKLDLLVTDWRLPYGCGGDIARAFGAKFPGAPRILITGFLGTDEFLEQSGGLNFAARFQKPFDVLEFQAAVRKALEPGGGAKIPGGK